MRHPEFHLIRLNSGFFFYKRNKPQNLEVFGSWVRCFETKIDFFSKTHTFCPLTFTPAFLRLQAGFTFKKYFK